MAAPSAFVPKQAMPRDDRLFEIIGASETLTIAKHEMMLLPPFPPGSIIHDAACGLGPVTEAILEAMPPQDLATNNITILATDLAPSMVAIYNMFADQKQWPTKAVIMDAQKLEWEDHKFTHSILSFGLPIITDPVAAAKELYRTTKPGGTALTAFWLDIPQGETAGETRRALWGPDARLAMEPPAEHKDAGFIRNLLVKGGFSYEDVQLYETSTVLPVKDLDELACAIWSAIGEPFGGWTQEDEERWDEALAKYKSLLMEKKGFHKDENGNITLEAVAQIAIVKRPEV